MGAGQRSFFRPDGMVLPSPVPGRPIGGRRKFHRFVCGHARRAAAHHHQAVGQHLQQTGVLPQPVRANENVYQAIGDLGYLLDKDDYLELFGRFSALVARATSAMPSRRQAILSAMGVRERELADRAEIILRS